MADPTVRSYETSDRLERALAAFLRQELNAPVVTMKGFLEIVVDDARRFGLDNAIPDLERMRTACSELGALVGRVIDSPDAMRKDEENFEAFQSRLRHDLRTPLNAIKGYCELLIEDVKDGGQTQLLPDLEKVNEAADQMLDQIDAMVERTREQSPDPGVKQDTAAGRDRGRPVARGCTRRLRRGKGSARVREPDSRCRRYSVQSRPAVTPAHA